MASAQDRKTDDPSVADEQANAKLKHSVDGVTTRDDKTDLGVPMLPGQPDEPTGPEDALGEGPKRGDYTGRIGPSNYHPHESVRTDDGVTLAVQRPRADEIGDEPGKGGVTSA